MADKQTLVKLLKVLIEIAESASDEDLEDLQRGGLASLRPKNGGLKSPSKKRLPPSASTVVAPDPDKILEELFLIPSRESAVAYLGHHELTKRSLEAIARKMDVPVSREDNTKTLMEKIIEGSVGARLRSEAIRGRVS